MLTSGYGYRPNGKGKANYSQIGGPNGYLANLVPFTGNSMWARWEGDAYVVYSYATEIAVWHTSDNVWLNDHKYSVTTSRQQSLVNAWLGYNHGRANVA